MLASAYFLLNEMDGPDNRSNKRNYNFNRFSFNTRITARHPILKGDGLDEYASALAGNRKRNLCDMLTCNLELPHV